MASRSSGARSASRKAREFYEREKRRPEPVGTGPPPGGRWVPRPAVAHHPWPTRCATCCRHSPVLYGGLGRHQVERLSVMRTACKRTWEHYARDRTLPLDFDSFFQEVLAQFDTQGDEFAPQRVRDELIGQMSELLGIGYDVLALDLTGSESRHRALVSDPTPPAAPPALPSPTTGTPPPPGVASSIAKACSGGRSSTRQPSGVRAHLGRIRPETTTESPRPHQAICFSSTSSRRHRRPNGCSRSSAWLPTSWAMRCRPTSRRRAAVHPGASRRALSDLRRLVHRRRPGRPIGCASTSRSSRARSPGRQPGRVHRGSLRWHRLRLLRARHAPSPLGRAVLALLITLTGQPTAEAGVDGAARRRLASTAARPGSHHGDCTRRLSDTALVKLFRLLRLARRLLDLEAGTTAPGRERGGRMSTSHPLNQAVIAQALYDLRNGQLRRCKAMGFGEAELDALKHPALISVLANASVSWCSVTVNREVLQRLLNQVQDVGRKSPRSIACCGWGQHGDGQPLLWPDPSGSRLRRGDPRPAQAQGAPPRPGRDPGHRTLAAMESRDQQQERRSGG